MAFCHYCHCAFLWLNLLLIDLFQDFIDQNNILMVHDTDTTVGRIIGNKTGRFTFKTHKVGTTIIDQLAQNSIFAGM